MTPTQSMKSTLSKLSEDEAVSFAQANIQQFIDQLTHDGYEVDQERFQRAQQDTIQELRTTAQELQTA